MNTVKEFKYPKEDTVATHYMQKHIRLLKTKMQVENISSDGNQKTMYTQ